MPQISERRRMQNRIAQRKFRDKKQQQQLALQHQQQQQQQEQHHHEQRQRSCTNSYISNPPVTSARRKSSIHEIQHTRPSLKHMPQPHGLPMQMPEPVFTIPDYSHPHTQSTYGSEFGDLLAPDELSCLSAVDDFSFSDKLNSSFDLEFQHFNLSSELSIPQSMSQTPYTDYSYPDDTLSFGDTKPSSTACSSHRASFSSTEAQYAMSTNPYFYPRNPSNATACSYNSTGSAWSNFSSATTETAVTTPNISPETYQPCYFSAAAVPIAEPKASSVDAPNFLRSWSGMTSPPQQEIKWQSALHVSAKRGREAIVKQLISQGNNINELDSDGFTALQLAMHNGHQGIVRLLMEHGADMNATAGPMWGPYNGTSLDPLVEDLSYWDQ